MEEAHVNLSRLSLERPARNQLLHVAVTPEVVESLQVRFHGNWIHEEYDEGHERALREELFLTDIVNQLLDALGDSDEHTINLIGRIAETHEERIEVCSRGFAAALSQVASRPLAFFRTPSWLWLLHNFAYYFTDAEISPEIINGAVDALLSPSHLVEPWHKQMALGGLMRIALRGPAVHGLLAHRGGEVADWCSRLLVRDGCWVPAISHDASFASGTLLCNACFMMSALAYALGETSHGLAPTAAGWLRWQRAGSDAWLARYAQRHEAASRRHLARTHYLRPGESWHMYLGMLRDASDDVRFVGAVMLAVMLEAVGPNSFAVAPFETPSARVFLELALEARVRKDAALTRHDVHTLRHAATRAAPHALLAEAVLRLEQEDPCQTVRQLGAFARARLPRAVLQEIVWCPSNHHLFHPGARALVRCMLLVSQRGDVPIPSDLLVMHILPNACLAVE